MQELSEIRRGDGKTKKIPITSDLRGRLPIHHIEKMNQKMNPRQKTVAKRRVAGMLASYRFGEGSKLIPEVKLLLDKPSASINEIMDTLADTCWRGPLLAHGNYESSLVYFCVYMKDTVYSSLCRSELLNSSSF